MRRAAPLALVALLFGCPQTVVVYPDGSVEDADAQTSVDGDGGTAADSGVVSNDDGGTDDDGGTLDGGVDPCSGTPFCLALTVSADRVNVREAVEITAVLDNPQSLDLRIDLCEPAPRFRRAANRPTLNLDEIGYQLERTDAEVFTFAVNEVPPWFIATTFGIEVCVYEGAEPDPKLRVPAEVHVRGNVLISAQYQGVFAVGSDGRPATGKAGRYPEAKLLDDSITFSGALRLAADGTLLVFDSESSPSRIAKYALDGQDVRLQTFDYAETQLGVPPIYYDNVAIFSLAELPDGSIALADSHNSGTPTPRLMIWNADGTFQRQILGANASHEWHSVAALDAELLVGRSYNIPSFVIRVDPSTGIELDPPFTDDLRKIVYALEPLPDGRVAIGAERLAMIAGAGGAAVTINDIPDGSSRDYRAIARFDDMILFANDHQGDSENVAVVDGRNFVRWLRVPGSGGPIIVPYGLAYLE